MPVFYGNQLLDDDQIYLKLTDTTPLNSATFSGVQGQSVFAFDYVRGLIDVKLNGKRLKRSAYTATNGTSVTLATPIASNYDVLTIDGFMIEGSQNAAGNFLAYGGTANAITLTSNNAQPAKSYKDGAQYKFRATATNTGAATISVDGLPAKACKTITGAALASGHIRTDMQSVATYYSSTDSFVVVSDVGALSTETSPGAVVRATPAQALAGTPDVIPDAEDVHAAFKQFGLGVTPCPDIGTDFNSGPALIGGLYRYNGDESNSVGGYGCMLSIPYSGNRTFQLVASNSTPGNVWARVNVLGAWTVKRFLMEGDSITVTSAGKWTTGRTFTFTGGATGTSAAVDGSANVSIALTVSNSGHTHTAAQIGTATAGLAFGSVGTYCLCYVVGGSLTEGNTVSGSSIYPAGFGSTTTQAADFELQMYTTRGGTALSGTWRLMGRQNRYTGSSVGLFMRIS